jgi:peptidylprolyl isomerase
MRRVQHGDSVTLHLVARLAASGEVIDATKEVGQPLSFVVGQHTVVRGLEDAVVGLARGESRTVAVESERAFGLRDERLVMEIERDRIPAEAAVGDLLRVDNKPVSLIEMTGSFVVVDGNHPLAGQALSLDIELVEIAGP